MKTSRESSANRINCTLGDEYSITGRTSPWQGKVYAVRKDINRIRSLMGQTVDSDGHEGILGSGNALDPGGDMDAYS